MIDKGAVRDLGHRRRTRGRRACADLCQRAAAGIARSTCEASRSQTSETAKGVSPRSWGIGETHPFLTAGGGPGPEELCRRRAQRSQAMPSLS